ncbi:MAG TPA: prepilin-type N-terminal cleavage/methylation domain-containing protein [Acidimicrobiales bacterium]
MTRLARDQRGFTLAELLIVIAVLGVMLAGLLAVQMQGQQSYLIGSHRVEAQQNARVALEMMIRELRSATSVTAIPGANNMTFVDENGASIQYQLAGTTINRTAICGGCNGLPDPLIGGVTTFNLTFFSDYDGSTNTGTTTTDPTLVKLVRVQLVTGTEESVASYSAANQVATIEALVRLRNT